MYNDFHLWEKENYKKKENSKVWTEKNHLEIFLPERTLK